LKKLRKAIFIFISGLLILFASVSVYLYYNQDKVINQLVVSLNKQLRVPIEVKSINVNWYTDFPKIAVVFKEITIKEAIEGSNFNLAKLKQLSLSFSPLDLIRGNYVFDKVNLKNGEVTIRISPTGARNYLIVRKKEKSEAPAELNFDLSEVNLENVKINYVDESVKQSYLTQADKLKARIQKKAESYFINVEGKLLTEAIKIGELSYFKNKSLQLETQIIYNEETQAVLIKPSTLLVNKSAFEVDGNYKINSSYIDLKIEGIDTELKTLSSLLPDKYKTYLNQYQLNGGAQFKTSIKGTLNSKNNPLVVIDFSVNDGSIYEPTFKTKLNAIQLTGNFTNGKAHSFKTSILRMNNMEAQLADQEITASLQLQNFDNYYLKLKSQGVISTNDLFAFLPEREQYEDLSGQIDFNISLAGRVNDFKKASTAVNINNSGEIILRNVGAVYKKYPLPISKLNARLLFNKNDIAINSFTGSIGASDLKMNGFFLNIFPFLFQKEQALLIEATTSSNYIDLNELLSGLSSEKSTVEKQQESLKFEISPYLRLALKSKIKQLTFQNFNGRNIRGKITVDNESLKADNLFLNSMGGSMKLSGSINTKSANEVAILSNATFDQLNIDSIFYTFKDFDQNFLTQKHLKGKINADVMAQIVLDKSLNFKPEKFTASIAANVQDGELNNFEPMQSLSDYVNEAQLANLTFGELSNSIQIKNKTIYLPEMLIKSNISEILIQGTHTFDQQIDYRLLVPLKNYKRPDKDEAFGAIEETDEYTRLHLKITGTTDDFKVSWDAKKSLKSVGQKFKEEGKKFVKILTGKELEKDKKKEVEVTEDDYFDW